MQNAATTSEVIAILTLLLCGVGSVAMLFGAYVLHDLRGRVMRIENRLFGGGGLTSSPQPMRKAGIR